ncbi:MAG: ACP S-malonyltransferase [Alphaproteobacteria bacterium]
MTTVVFPGQGSQYTGMSKDFYDNFNIARVTFQEIEEFTEMNLRKIIFDNKDNELDITKYTQISIFTSSLIIFKTIQKELDISSSSIDVMMGHSLGEYSALACSDKLSLKDACLILKKRGQLMNDAVPQNKSGMAALIGKDSNYVQKIIKDNNINLEVANDNSPKQVVISGDISEIKNNKELFLKNNIIKYVILNVSAAFHSKLMLEAQEELSEIINQVNFNSNKINIISNYNAEVSNDSLSIKKSLQQQMANKVNWTNSVKKLSEIGQKNIIEIGPGKVLSGLIKRISNNFDIKSINKISDI